MRYPTVEFVTGYGTQQRVIASHYELPHPPARGEFVTLVNANGQATYLVNHVEYTLDYRAGIPTTLIRVRMEGAS